MNRNVLEMLGFVAAVVVLAWVIAMMGVYLIYHFGPPVRDVLFPPKPQAITLTVQDEDGTRWARDVYFTGKCSEFGPDRVDDLRPRVEGFPRGPVRVQCGGKVRVYE